MSADTDLYYETFNPGYADVYTTEFLEQTIRLAQEELESRKPSEIAIDLGAGVVIELSRSREVGFVYRTYGGDDNFHATCLGRPELVNLRDALNHFIEGDE